MNNWQKWLYGLLAGFIGAGAQGALGVAGIALANVAGVPVPQLNLKQVGIVFVSAGIVSALAYLKQSPLPAIAETTVVTTKQEVTETKTVTPTDPPKAP